MITNTVFYLIGFAGVGKYTIAKALADRLPCKIVDNHYVLNPIFNLIAQDGVTPLPARVWDHAMQVRLAILGTIRDLSPPSWNFVFTNELVDDPAGSSQVLYAQVFEVAQARGSRFVPVRLLCDVDEHAQRITRPERRERMKGVSAAEAREKQARHVLFRPDHPNTLTLDVTNLSPEAAAQAILEHARACP